MFVILLCLAQNPNHFERRDNYRNVTEHQTENYPTQMMVIQAMPMFIHGLNDPVPRFLPLCIHRVHRALQKVIQMGFSLVAEESESGNRLIKNE